MSKLSGLGEVIKKHKKLTIAGVIIIIVAIVGTTIGSKASERKAQMEAIMNQTQTSKVEKRTLVSSVSATGTLVSAKSKEVTVDLSGVEVESVLVQLGDMVEEGQVLCEFDSKDIEENLAEAKTALEVTKKKTQMDLTAAERNLEDAREDYDTDLKRGNTDLGVAYNDYVLAVEDVEEAESAWNSAKENMYLYRGEYEYRQELVTQKKAQLDAVGGSSEVFKQEFANSRNMLEQNISALNNNSDANDDVTLGTSAMDKIGLGNDLSMITVGDNASGSVFDFSTSDSAVQAQINNHIDALVKLQESYKTVLQLEQEYASLQQEAANMQSKYNSAVQNESSAEKTYEQAVSASQSELSAYQKQQRSLEDTTKSAENNVINKTESLTTAQLNALSSGNSEEDKVEQYQQQLEDCVVEAPISGIISAVNIETGDTYNGAAIVTIDDISSFEITAQIDEYDIGKIEKGQKVVIKTNATGEEELEGTVKIISPKASSGSSSVSYEVIISVDTPHEMLRMDMTAKLSIILESKENVITVPYEAVQEDASGKYYVEVVSEGKESEEENQERPQMPEGMDFDNMPQMSEGMEFGDMPQMPEGMEFGNSSKKPEGTDKENKSQGKSGSSSSKKIGGGKFESTDLNTRKIYVEKGIESDYYIEIISDEIMEGMEVVVPKTESNFNNIQNMMMRQGPMGGF